MSALFEGDVDGEVRHGYKRALVLSSSRSSAQVAAEHDTTNHSAHEERQAKQARIPDPAAPPAQLQPVAPVALAVHDVEPVAHGAAPSSIYALPEKVAKRMKNWAIKRITELELWASGTGDNEDEGEHTITIAHGVTAAEFNAALSDVEKLPCKFALINGDVIIYELPSDPHAQTIIRLSGEIEVFNVVTANRTLVSATSPRITFGPNTVLEPDITLRPRGLQVPPALAYGAGRPYPTVIFEIGWSEAVLSLHNLAAIYLGPNTSVQLYVAIKIYQQRTNQDFALLALLYSRANVPHTTPILAISCGTAPVTRGPHLPPVIQANLSGVGFGGPACNQPRLPQYQLPLPVATIYQGVALPAGLPANLNIDLYEIQRQIFD